MHLFYFMEQDSDLCKNCLIRGKCCYFSILIENHNILLPNHPCKFLDLEKLECTVHSTRFTRNKFCLTVEQGKQRGCLPIECPYLEGCSEKHKSAAVVDYDIVKDDLSEKGKLYYELTNKSAHNIIARYDYNETPI